MSGHTDSGKQCPGSQVVGLEAHDSLACVSSAWVDTGKLDPSPDITNPLDPTGAGRSLLPTSLCGPSTQLVASFLAKTALALSSAVDLAVGTE